MKYSTFHAAIEPWFPPLTREDLELVSRRTTNTFETFCSERGLRPLAMDVDRHGSLEWTGYRQDTLNRYLSVFVTPTPSVQPSKPLELELWYSVDDTHHYLRRRLGNPRRVTPPYFHSHRPELTNLLHAAMQAVEEITPRQLTEPIPFAIYGPGSGAASEAPPDRLSGTAQTQ